jgi:hypothetical protein
VTADTDITLDFEGTTNSGQLKWMEDEDYFEFVDDILLTAAEKIQFRATTQSISSDAVGYMDITATTAIRLNQNTDITGALTITTALDETYGGTGQSTITTGDVLYGSASNVLSKLAVGTKGQILRVNDGGTNVEWDTPTRSKSITIEDPVATEDISIFFTNKAITITEMRAVVRGTTPSVTWTIRHNATDRSAAGAEVVTSGTTTTSESTGDDVTSFNDATIAADSFVWLETTAQTGTVDELHVTIIYRETTT